MIKGTGIDIVEVARIAQSLSRGDNFRKLVFSEEEIAYCEQQGRRGHESYAGRFAAKEAFLKALGTGWRGELQFHEVTFINDEMGKPYLVLKGKSKAALKAYNDCRIHVSISHTPHYATAMVIIEEI
jgi:holo-[acyl-carrier protein] synthase